MPHLKLSSVLAKLKQDTKYTEKFFFAAEKWADPIQNILKPKFTTRHRLTLTEMAFLNVFISLEKFLEESFILYLLGKIPPSGKSPTCYVKPSTRKIAEQLTIPEGGKKYSDWSSPSLVASRAEKYFKQGEPFANSIKLNQALIDNMKTIRNVIAHSSVHSIEKFHTLVRNEIATVPSDFRPGDFLITVKPNSSPPIQYFEYYNQKLLDFANQIIQ